MFSCVYGKPQPAMYEIRSADEGTTLIIHIREEVWPQVLLLLKTSPYRPIIEQNLRIPPFIAPSSLPWGFGPVFMEEPTNNPHWHIVRCELPQFFRWSSKDDWAEASRWTRAFCVSASIHWLLQCATYASTRVQLAGDLTQRIEVYTGARRDSSGTSCCISAGLSSPVCQWIRRQDSEELCAKLTRCMTNTYLRVYGKERVDRFDAYELGAKIRESPHLVFNCPGDRCSLYPSLSSSRNLESGYELCDHNVDSPLQQLVLLMGVATLASYYYADQ